MRFLLDRSSDHRKAHGMLRPIPVRELCCTVLLASGCFSASAADGDVGMASFYAQVPDRSEKLTAAHRSLPFGTMVSVIRTDTGAHVVVWINDRGPFVKGRIIDLSHPAAEQLGLIGIGLARVRIQVVPAPVRAVRKAATAP
jgi:rare lipoprotein A